MIRSREKKKRGKRMSFKKRMFRSNMMILFTALLSLMLILLLVLILFEDSLENQVYAISQTRIESHVGEVVRLMASDDMQSAEKLRESVEQWGYRTAVIAHGKVVSGDGGEQMMDLAEFFQEEDDKTGGTDIFFFSEGHGGRKVSCRPGRLPGGCVFSPGKLACLIAESFLLCFPAGGAACGDGSHCVFIVFGFLFYPQDESGDYGTH